MSESFLLRENPKLKFIFHEYGFEVVNQKEKERRSYVYEFVNSFEFKKSPINWFVSALSIVFDFAIGGGATGGTFREKNEESFNLTYDNKTFKIDLFNCDLKKAKLITKRINSKINS
jgi:hypothetical protein